MTIKSCKNMKKLEAAKSLCDLLLHASSMNKIKFIVTLLYCDFNNLSSSNIGSQRLLFLHPPSAFSISSRTVIATCTSFDIKFHHFMSLGPRTSDCSQAKNSGNMYMQNTTVGYREISPRLISSPQRKFPQSLGYLIWESKKYKITSTCQFLKPSMCNISYAIRS